MKKLYTILLLSISICLSLTKTNATVWNVVVQPSSFVPATLPNVVCGDTIIWTLGGGSPHTTTSTSIPAGATAWDAPITNASPVFAYVVPDVAGVYNYVCTPHGFTGSFTVTCSVNTGEQLAKDYSRVYPNPFTANFTVEYNDADELRITNLGGILIKSYALNPAEHKKEVFITELPSGVYMYTILKEGIVIVSKKIMKN
jgi:plastocyanin